MILFHCGCIILKFFIIWFFCVCVQIAAIWLSYWLRKGFWLLWYLTMWHLIILKLLSKYMRGFILVWVQFSHLGCLNSVCHLLSLETFLFSLLAIGMSLSGFFCLVCSIESSTLLGCRFVRYLTRTSNMWLHSVISFFQIINGWSVSVCTLKCTLIVALLSVESAKSQLSMICECHLEFYLYVCRYIHACADCVIMVINGPVPYSEWDQWAINDIGCRV